jgi:hypothetical protein
VAGVDGGVSKADGDHGIADAGWANEQQHKPKRLSAVPGHSAKGAIFDRNK